MTDEDHHAELSRRVHAAIDPILPRDGAARRAVEGARDRFATSGSRRTRWWKPFKSGIGGAVVVLVVAAFMGGVLGLTLSLRDRPGAVTTPEGGTHPASTPLPTSTSQSPGSTLPQTRSFPLVAGLLPIEASDGCSQESMAFIDGRTGWLAHNGAVIARTTDGGRTWTDQYRAAQSNAVVQDVDFINAQDGFAVVSWTGAPTAGGVPLFQELIRTVDGGITWSVAAPASTGIACVDFLTPSIGYATTSSGQLAVSNDGGVTWAHVTTPGSVIAPCFQSGGVGWVATASGVYGTSDGGAHWTLSYRPGFVDSLSSADQLQCFDHSAWLSMFLGEGMNQTAAVIVRTLDDGAHWKAIDNQGIGGPDPNTPSAPDLLQPHPGPFQLTGPEGACLTSSNSVVVDVQLTVTRDGGTSVSQHQVVSGSPAALDVVPVGISFITPTDGWLLLSTDTLQIQTDAHPSQSTLRAQLMGQGPTHLVLLHTSDAGASWTWVSTLHNAASLS